MAGSGVVLKGRDLPVHVVLNASSGTLGGTAAQADIIWNLRPAIRVTRPNTLMQVSVVMTDVPYCWPNITAANNVLNVAIAGVVGVQAITFPPGRWETFQLNSWIVTSVNAIANVLNTARSTVNLANNSIGLVRADGGAAVTLVLEGSTIAPILGLVADVALPNFPARTDIGPVNLAYLGSKVYIRSPSIHTRNYLVRAGNNCQPTDILAELPVGWTSPWGMIQSDLSNQRQFINEAELQQIRIQLTNREGTVFEFPVALRDWTITLRFDQVEAFEVVKNSTVPDPDPPSRRRKTAI